MLNHPDPIEGMRPMYVLKDERERAVIYEVVSEADGHVSFVRAGGGGIHSSAEAEFLELFEPLPAETYRQMMNRWEPGIATGDWFEESADGVPAFFTASTWNGFACPYFEKDDMIAAINDGRVEGVRWMAEVEAFLEIETCGEPIPEHDYAAEARVMTGKENRTISVNGMEIELSLVTPQSIVTDQGPKLVYPVGAYAWCWHRQDQEPAAAPSI